MRMKIFISFIIACALLAGVFVFFSKQDMASDKNGLGAATTEEDSNTFVPTVSASVNEVSLTPDVTADVSGLSIRFNSLVQDNRCPVDVQCIEAGAVTANVTLENDGKSETRNLPSDEVPYEFNGYKVSIVSVSPEARSTVSIKPNEYKVTFKVE
jgi:hypothetical protein